jgi:hypothetical protein
MRASYRILVAVLLTAIAVVLFATFVAAADLADATILWATGLWLIQFQVGFAVAWMIRLKNHQPFNDDPAAKPHLDLPAWDEEKIWVTPKTCWQSAAQWREVVRTLESEDADVRRQMVQALVDVWATPIAQIDCWPEQNCTDLQLKTAEALLRDWAEELELYPNATDRYLIDQLFEWEAEPRVRKLAEPYAEIPAPSPKPQPQVSVLLDAAMDRLNDAVKDTILDWKPDLPETDDEPEEEIALVPLDRPRFAEEMNSKFNALLEHLAETVAAPRTNLELAKTEAEVGRFLHELRWDALNLALELRAPDEAYLSSRSETVSPPSPHRFPPEKPAEPSSGGWAKKFRRMKALGY